MADYQKRKHTIAVMERGFAEMEPYQDGLVSVIIPTYKRSDLLMKAIASVQEQTYQQIEILVVNDNEKGDEYSCRLANMLAEIHDPRLQLIEQEKHINGAAARNAGIRAAKGEYISFQDDDDYWEPNKLEIQVHHLQSLDKSWGAVACMKRFYRDGRLVGASLPFSDKNLLLRILEGTVSLGTGAVLIRRTALDDAGYFDENLRRHQDVQLFARIASKYSVALDKVYLHNRELKDSQNRPTADSILEIKRAFFNSIEDLITAYPARIQKRIYALHYFEAAHCFLKEKRYRETWTFGKRLLCSPSACLGAVRKIAEKIVSVKCKRLLNGKYSYRT